MNKKYTEIKNKFKKLETDLQSPEVINDMKKLKTVSQEYNELKDVVEKIDELEKSENAFTQAQEIIEKETDTEMKELAKDETEELQSKIKELNKALDELTIPQDPMDKKKCYYRI